MFIIGKPSMVKTPSRSDWQAHKQNMHIYDLQRLQESWIKIKRILGIPLSRLLLQLLLLPLEALATVALSLEGYEFRVMSWILKRRST